MTALPAKNPRSLRPADLLRLLNSTPLGQVLDERRLYRHRMAAGYRIEQRGRIDLIGYASWLCETLISRRQSEASPKMPDRSSMKSAQYDAHRAAAAQRQADIAAAGQEIGPPPKVVNPKRRKKCQRNLKLFCTTYFPAIFYLKWSKDHLKAIKKIEQAVLAGRLFALAMPRGSGKTSLMIVAVIWAIVYGHHQFVCLIASTERRARKLLGLIYAQLERNDRLMEGFPAVCFPIRKLERTPQRAGKQKCQGDYTLIYWTKNEIVLPSVKGSPSSGTIVTVCGLTGGEVLGQIRNMPNGSQIRPSLVLLDDPQTHKSAKSRTQTEDRLDLLQGDVLGMAGPDQTLSGFLPCTVIEPGDMADQILDIEKHPEWHGLRTSMVNSWPTNEKLWDEYATLWAEGLRSGKELKLCTDFYRQNRAAMDIDCKVSWPDAFPAIYLSAIQHAMTLRLKMGDRFYSEYQNQPLIETIDSDHLTAEQIVAKLSRRKHLTVPTTCSHVVAYIDVHKRLLFYTVVAFDEKFTGYVIDYGIYPDNKKRYFTMRQCRRTLLTVARGHGEEAAIFAGLEKLTEKILPVEYKRDDGAALKINLCLIDCGYKKDVIDQFCRQSKFTGRVLPGKGLSVSASNIPLTERKKNKGEKIGDNWRLTGAQGRHSVRLVLIDTNYYKTFLQARLTTPMGDRGCLSLWGTSDTTHKLFSEHMTSEYCVQTSGRGRELLEWKEYPHRPDNHWLDCMTGCMAIGSILGCKLIDSVVPKAKPRKRKKRKTTYF